MPKINIKNITKINHKLDRYDLTINSTHNFYANGILIHNTSCRVGILPCIDYSWKARLLRWLGIDIKNHYRFVVGSRHCLKHVEKENIDLKESYYKDDIWTESAYKYFHEKLVPGETVYYEIVGFLPSGESIMPQHDNKKLEKFLEKQEYKDFIKKFGNETIFHYGCNAKQIIGCEQINNDEEIEFVTKGEYKIFVYRITLTTEHGQSIDCTWEQVKRRCEEMSVNHVPEIHVPIIINKYHRIWATEEYWIKLTEQDDSNFPQHLNEGICVRIESAGLRPQIYKNKRYAFKCLEGIIKDTAKFADIEESN